MQKSNNQNLRIAFSAISGDQWAAGIYYLENLFFALNSVNDEFKPKIDLLVRDQFDNQNSNPYVNNIIQIPKWFNIWNARSIQLWKRLGIWLGVEPFFSSYLAKKQVDIVFSRTDFGTKFNIPLLCWIPDFQHLHFPEMFSEKDLISRNKGYAKIAENADRIVLSSQNAVQDFINFAPKEAHKARVLSFVAQIPDDIYDKDPTLVCNLYHLPNKFYYLPNQFWKHKNHETVIQALAIAKKQRQEITIVCTGNLSDYRNPLHSSELLEIISKLNIRQNFIILGTVPHVHVFQLIRQSIAVLQPSLFEGWSTTVEETKSLGKSIILSDIPVHREQNPPEATFFDTKNADMLAECMVKLFDNKKPGPDLSLESTAKALLGDRTKQFGKSFFKIVREII